MEAETGVTKNEPSQLAVKEAIDKAVDLLIVEGIADGIWRPKGGEAAIEYVKKAYMKERIDAEKTELIIGKKKIEELKYQQVLVSEWLK